MKFIGYILLLCAFFMGGKLISQRYKNRYTMVNSLYEFIQYEITLLSFAPRGIAEVLTEQSQRVASPLNDVFKNIAEKLSTNTELGITEVWLDTFEHFQQQLYFNKEQQELAAHLGRALSLQTKETLISELELLKDQFNTQRVLTAEEKKEKGPLFEKLCFLAGAFVIILLL